MSIVNLSRSTTVAAEASEADTFMLRLVGLMGRAHLPPSAALIIDSTNWIHTFWMRFPLDIIYIDRQWKVIGIEMDLPPNRIGKPFLSAHSVIELNAGAIRASHTQPGDQLQFTPAPAKPS